MKNYYLTLLFLGVVYYGYGQVGIGTTLPNTSSELDVVSGNKGILIPRVSLTSTIDAITITNGNVNSLLVFNTQTIADITPGYYYWYVNKWYRLGTSVSETVTTLIDNGDGTITYTNESGTPVTINVPKGVQGAAGTNGTNGIDGAVGATGPQGPIGLTGTAGANGTNGTNGIDGAVGATGPQGPIGLTGPAGANGTNGIDGATGPQGPIGLTGPAGANGTNGIDGATGPQGPIGLTGPAGANGTDGIDGAVGATGPQGPIGLTGPAGANGTDGIDGAVGATGPQGPIGLTGLAGANGTNGIDGATGPQGPIGLTGPAGANGTNGIDGATGPQGPIGLTGPAGTNGIDGAVGATGPQGPIGLTGPAGTNGIDGAVGATGPQGPIGLTGPAGTNGIDGAVGATGPIGLTGPAGANGTNGIDGAVGVTGPQGPAGTNGVGGVTTAGTNITITGAGTVASPYIVNASSPTQTNTTLALDTTTNILTYTNENSDNPTINLSTLKIEPWQVQTTTDKATLNSENIYQMGTVAIGKNEVLADVALDVQGAIRVGSNHIGLVGANSAAFGDNVSVYARNSMGIGNQNEIFSDNALIIGLNNLIGVNGNSNAIFGSNNKEYNAGGIWSNNTIFGDNNTMTGEEGGPTLRNNTVFGEKNIITSIGSGAHIYNNTIFGNNNWSGISSSNSTIFGEYNLSDSYNQFIIGKANRNINGSIFEIGIGADASNRANALTVIPNGNVGIANEAVNPTEKLDIGSGNVRVRNINTNIGTTSDNIVVADINGVLKTVAVADLSLEPWQIENTTDKATTNSQNIYQNANVGIGDFTASNPIAKLDIRGAVRGGTPHTTELDGSSLIGTNSASFGTENRVSGLNTGAFGANNFTGVDFQNGLVFGDNNVAADEPVSNSLIFGNSNEIEEGINNAIWGTGNGMEASNAAVFGNRNGLSNTAINSLVFGTGNRANANNTLVAGQDNNSGSYNEVVFGQNNAITTGTPDSWVLTDPLLQVGNGEGTQSNALTILKNGNTGINTEAPNSALTVNGSANNLLAYDAGTDTTIDYAQSNLAYTTADAGNTFDLQNIKDGGTYTLAVQGSVSGTANFTSAGFTVHLPVDNGPSVVTGGKHSIYTILVLGTHVYMSWITGL